MYYGYLNMEYMCLDKRVGHGMCLHVDSVESFVMDVFITGYNKPNNKHNDVGNGIENVDAVDRNTDGDNTNNMDSNPESTPITTYTHIPPLYKPSTFHYSKANAHRWHHSVCRLLPDYKDLELRIIRILEALTHPLAESVRNAAIDYNGGVLPHSKTYSGQYYCHIDTHRFGGLYRNAGVVFPSRSVIRQIHAPIASIIPTATTVPIIPTIPAVPLPGSTATAIDIEEDGTVDIEVEVEVETEVEVEVEMQVNKKRKLNQDNINVDDDVAVPVAVAVAVDYSGFGTDMAMDIGASTGTGMSADGNIESVTVIDDNLGVIVDK